MTITDDTLSADLEDGRTISVPVGWYPRLAYATPAERAYFQITGAGHGIHWPDLDEDLGVEGLLLGRRSNESSASFKRWLDDREAQKVQKGHKEKQQKASIGAVSHDPERAEQIKHLLQSD